MKKRALLFLIACIGAISLNAAPLVIDSGNSSVQVDVKANPPHRFTCDLTAYDANVDIDPVAGTVTQASFRFQLTDLDSHNAKRDKKMYNWMDTDRHNTIQWEMTAVEEIDGRKVAHGEFTMHGVKHPVDVAFALSHEHGQWMITGDADFNYMEFDLPKIRLLVFTVNPDLHVRFTLKGVLSQN